MERLAHSERKTTSEECRIRLEISGVVQGVGFRPHVYRLAQQQGLAGWVQNQSGKVVIEVQGASINIEVFGHQLISDSPQPIQIQSIHRTPLPTKSEVGFVILPSSSQGREAVTFPADLALCSNCIDDINNHSTRFHNYPFISCTCCGPRFTTIRSLPYDRQFTSFEAFHMCELCKAEFQDPSNRRFHAQTIACPHCGPSIEMVDRFGKKLSDDNDLSPCHHTLMGGGIIAVKGIGGFHLICDATQPSAVRNLRLRKGRPNKPLAIMAQNLATIIEYFEVSAKELEALESPAAPIVLLRPKGNAAEQLPLSTIAPGLARIGVFLAYSPLHHLVFGSELKWLVATSGNASGLPMTYTNCEALKHLQGIADLFVLHNRDIVIWNDDSVGQVAGEEFQFIRRSRGYVPEAIEIALPIMDGRLESKMPVVLGVGAEAKNTFCYIDQGKAIVSQHMGDIDTLEGLAAHNAARNHFETLLSLKPQIIAYDPHPDYMLSQEIRNERYGHKVPVYHHHAHMASCMAEHQIASPVIGCILDGTGYGPDGKLWGCEILTGDYVDFERVVHLKPIRLPGGEAAIRNPWMTGLSLIYEAAERNADIFSELALIYFPQYKAQLPIIWAQLSGRLSAPEASSAGRLFDGISAILNVCTESSYDGEAAMCLSEIVETGQLDQGGIRLDEKYLYHLTNDQWDIAPMIKQLHQDIQSGLPIVEMAYKYHHTVAYMVFDGVRKAHLRTGINQVVLSGGVWNNKYLQAITKSLLASDGFRVYSHSKVPAGDGGVALGQAVCGIWRWAKDHVLIGTVDGH